MINIIKIAIRNLLRYTRRTLLTSTLIALGVTLVIVFSGIGAAFKGEIIGALTEANLGDIQIHKKGYVGSIDNLPLDKMIQENSLAKIRKILDEQTDVAAYSERIRFGALISSYVQTTSVRLTAVYPDKESKTCPALIERIKDGNADPESFVKPGNVVIPQNIAAGMNLKLGDDIVLVANNKDGAVNGITVKITGISENIMGPAGKDGYLHMDDAKSLLRIENGEISEIAVKLDNFNDLKKSYTRLKNELAVIKGTNTAGLSVVEIHTWEDLSPFSSIARIVDLLVIVVRIILISIVLISILNIMMMSVYERIGEIGTIASIGTAPSKILALFLTEGMSLGFFSGIIGGITGVLALLALKAFKLNFTFGMMNISIEPSIPFMEVAISIVTVVIVSTLASLQPALKASRMEPVEALRHV